MMECLLLISFNILSTKAPTAHPTAKNRFSRRFVLMQKGVACKCRQNECALHKTATYTRFWAVCSKMKCVLVLNAVRFGAKRKVKWC